MTRERLARFGLDADCRIYENRGRDILPFLRVANELADSGEELVLKLHTKRSTHRVDGDIWRRDLLDKLAGPANVQRLYRAFAEFPRLGMIAPEGHVLTTRLYWGWNEENVHYLCRRMGIAGAESSPEVFVAGSMFWARLDALRPLLDLHLDEAEFEAEGGHVDGTMGHAIERVMALAVKQAGLYLASTSQPSVECDAPEGQLYLRRFDRMTYAGPISWTKRFWADWGPMSMPESSSIPAAPKDVEKALRVPWRTF